MKLKDIFVYGLIVAVVLVVGLRLSQKVETPSQVATTEEQTIKEETADYSISVQYPKLLGSQNKKTEDDVNNILKGNLDRYIKEFKGSVSELPNIPAKKDLPKSEYKVTYTLDNLSNSYLGATFTFFEYLTLSAHPSTEITTFNFDLKNDRLVSVGDLFKPDSDYLRKISEITIGDLEKQMSTEDENGFDKSWVEQGAGPKAENFANFVLGKNSVIFLFNQYQVAPYASGEFKVEIPYDKINDMIDPNGPISLIK